MFIRYLRVGLDSFLRIPTFAWLVASSTVWAQWIGADAKSNVVVAADGTGTYKTIQEAINAVPVKGKDRFFIEIKPGIYREKILVSKHKGPITLYGTDVRRTVLTYDDYADKNDVDGTPLRANRSYTVKVESDDFAAENLTFENTHRKTRVDGDQALTLSLTGDREVFRKCRFTGWQDTVYANHGRQYFEDCYIAGQIDYIFGSAAAFFARCELHCLAPEIAITAASTERQKPYGYVFWHCKITAEPPANWRTHLGRPWSPYASVTFLYTEMVGIIAPKGWHSWYKADNQRTARFAEYKSTGPGGDPSKRVRWAKQLTDAEARRYTVGNVLKGSDGWNPTSDNKPVP